MPMAAKSIQDLSKTNNLSENFFITGSVVYEDRESGDVNLTIFRSDDEQEK